MTLAPQFRQVTFTGESEIDARTLSEYAEFWKIPHGPAPADRESTVFTTRTAPNLDPHIPTIISPTGTKQAEQLARNLGLTTSPESALLSLPVRPDTTVSIRTEIQEFNGANIETVLRSGEHQILSRIRGTNIHILSVDLVGEYNRRVYDGMEESPNWKFRLASKLPSSYQLIPRSIRERSFRSERGVSDILEENLGPVGSPGTELEFAL